MPCLFSVISFFDLKTKYEKIRVALRVLCRKVVYSNMLNFKDYSIISSFIELDQSGKEIESHNASIKKGVRFCLFCGRSLSETKFSKIAHAVSETLGNKRLVSNFECDECNEAFGRLLEDSLGKYIMPFKFTSGVFGKGSSLTIKDNSKDNKKCYDSYRAQKDQRNDVYSQDGELINYIIEQSSMGVVKLNNDGFSLNLKRQAYKPNLVYAAFLKMALGIIPLNKMQGYTKQALTLGSFTNQKDDPMEVEKYFKSLPNVGLLGFCPGNNPLNGTSVFLLQKDEVAECKFPKMLFEVDFNNFSICIPVLSDNENGTYSLPKPVDDNSYNTIVPIDFTKIESTYACSFSAEIKEIPKELITKLEHTMRNQKLLSFNDED